MNLICRACKNPMNPMYERNANGFMQCKYSCGCNVCEPACEQSISNTDLCDTALDCEASPDPNVVSAPRIWARDLLEEHIKEIEELKRRMRRVIP